MILPLRRIPAALLLLLLAVVAAFAVAGPAGASNPPEQTAAVPAPGASSTLTWTGTIPAGANPTSNCSTDVATNDSHKITFTVPAGFYDTATTKATFSITWADGSSDEILEVDGPDGFSQASDTSNTTESVTVSNPKAGDYTAIACPFTSSGPQAYTGKLELVSSTGGEPDLPSSDAKGLAFSASVPSDPQRDVSEPLIEIDPAGRSYTCGPTGFSNFSDYSNTSDDGGDQYHLLGTQPRGQQGSGGGGDCGLGTGVTKNAQGKYQYAYAGLGPLTGFTTSTSPDDGRTLFTAGPQGNTNTAKGGLADRQWLTFLNDKDVLLNYNQQRPRNVVVQKSTDGGYSYVTGNDAIAAHNPDFPGPMRTMPSNPKDPSSKRIAYFSWNGADGDGSAVYLSVSDETGLKWRSCRVQRLTNEQGSLQAFTVADNDRDGNIYVAYADEKNFHTYLTHLTADKLAACDEPVDQTPTSTAHPTKDPGWSAPVQMDRDHVRTTIFPWMVAGGAPGHVAVSYYGTESDGDPNPGSFKASWDVYVDQTTDALSAAPHVGQVKATTHPIHYDSICLLGLGCDLSVPAGDRGLGDFFAIDLNPATKKLQLVYNNTAKLPDASTGAIAAPMVVTQTGGPSNADGSTITPTADRATVRTTAADPAGDALVDYSFLNPTPPQTGGRSGSQTKVDALDLVGTPDAPAEVVGPEVDLKSGARVPDGGISVRMKLKDLSDAALQGALGPNTSAGSLVWAFRFVNGFQPAAAVAKWSAANGFTFGWDDYTVQDAPCLGTQGPKCETYPGATPIPGRVDQKAGTITLSIPRKLLTPLKGTTGPGQRPTKKAAGSAVPGDRFYDATAISFANPSPDPSTQSFMVNADNVRAMDFLLPGADAPLTVLPTGTAATGIGKACRAGGGFSSASATPKGRRVRFAFVRKVPAKATISVFAQSSGRRITGERLVARFGRRSGSFTWDGRANRRGRTTPDGFYFARFTVTSGGRSDVRRFVLERRKGRWVRRSPFYRRAACDALPSFKLERPVFGGRTNRPLNIAFRLRNKARVTVRVLRGARTVKTFGPTTRPSNVTQRLRLGASRLARGSYRVRITVAPSKGKALTSTLVSRRL